MTDKRKYDSTVARIAGNILPGLLAHGYGGGGDAYLAKKAVQFARLIVAEIERTDPAGPQEAPR